MKHPKIPTRKHPGTSPGLSSTWPPTPTPSSSCSRASASPAPTSPPSSLQTRCSPIKDIGPRLLDLRDRFGLSAPQIVRFLLVGSRTLRSGDVGPRLEFFISIFGSIERLLRIMKNNHRILSSDLERVIKPNIDLHHQCGISVRDIARLCSLKGWMLIKEFSLRAEKLGVHCSSRMFKNAVAAIACIIVSTKRRLLPSLSFWKSALGCSESQVAVAVAVCKMPCILGMSEKNLACKVQILLNEVGLVPQYIVEGPALLVYSLEKRLVPRHCVMKVLLAKGLLISNRIFYSLIIPREATFKLRYIDCHEDSAPGLADVYAAACAGVVPSGL